MSEKLLIAFFYLLIISCDNKDAIKPVTDLKDVSDSSSYALGADLGENLKKQYVELDYDAFLTGLRFGYDKGNVPLLTKEERKDAFQKLQASIRNKQQEQSKGNLKLAEEFLEKNKISDPDIKETPTGLQYRVIREGSGGSPTSMDQVQVHYEGRLLDDTIFDSSYEKDEPAVFRLNRVIKGWTEGLQLMTAGAEFEFFIHPKLGYGQRGNQNIPPNSALIFKVELLKIFEKNMK
tara:strand:+ start:251 stop:955 length:705 start_codon:yes stop_codon:yes gene_type:complete